MTGLTAGTAYTFAVHARDAAGNRSPRSGPVNITTEDTPGGTCSVAYRATLTDMWGGTPTQTGADVRAAAASVTVGFIGSKGATNTAPTAPTLNGGTRAAA